MEKRKKDFGLLFAAVLLMIAGAVGIVFAGDPATMEISSASVMTTSAGISTSTALTVGAIGTVSTPSAVTNTFLNSDIIVDFNQNVFDATGTKSKISLNKMTNKGVLTGSSIITESDITISNSAVTINPSTDLTANTFYAVTVNSGVYNSLYTIASDTTYQAIFKTGTETISSTPAASTTFSAILSSPASTGNTVTNAVNLNSAVFSFTFSEAVKNNGLNGDGIVTVTKTGGSSEAVASNGAIVASALTGGHITFPTLGTTGSTGASFTVDPTALEPLTTYQFKIKSTAASAAAKTLGTDVVYTFTTSADTIPVAATTFEAISLYPSNGEKDVLVGSDLQIGFTNTVALSNNITNGKAIQLLNGTTTLPAVFTLSDDSTIITIDPTSNLDYGTEYTLSILAGKINDTSGAALAASSITFKTTSFSDVTASAITSGSGLAITTELTNASSLVQKAKIAYVVRRDKGARLEAGGTVVMKGVTSTLTNCTANGTTAATINLADVTYNQFVSGLEGTIYVDLYILSNDGSILYDPIHVCAE